MPPAALGQRARKKCPRPRPRCHILLPIARNDPADAPKWHNPRQGIAQVGGQNQTQPKSERVPDPGNGKAEMNRSFNPHKRDSGALRLVWIATVVIVLGLGALSLHDQSAYARTGQVTPASLASLDFQMTESARQEVAQALSAMTEAELLLTYSRIHNAFRVYVGADDLSVARSLIDYARLAEAEILGRGLSRPRNTASPAEMMTTYNLVL
jgi:hypothetical protein